MRKVLFHHDMGFSEYFAGYAASGLTKPSENKTYSNKVGWDKRSVPNVLKEEFFLMVSIQ